MPVRPSGHLETVEDVAGNRTVVFGFSLVVDENDLFRFHFLSDFAELDVPVGLELLLAHLCDLEVPVQVVLLDD